MRVSDLTLGAVVGVEDRTMVGRRRVREGHVVGYHGRGGVTVQLSAWPQDRYRFRSDGSAGWLTPRGSRLVPRPGLAKGRRR